MIKFLDIGKINSQYQNELKEAANRVIDSGWYVLGSEVANFEKNLSTYIGVQHSIGVSNGLDGLRLILKSYIEMGVISPGDEIIVPSNTFIASVLAITDNGLIPVFVEPDIITYNIDFDKIEKKITEKTKAIMVVHLYGRVCWSEKLENISEKYNLKIIEDNVFIGPNATFTNDMYPKSKNKPEKFELTILKKGCSIGANATILPGITIGENSMVGAGCVVTKDVPEGLIVVGNPANIK